MTTTPPDVWEALEPLLGRVAKPTHFIDCVLGAVAPQRSSSFRVTSPLLGMAERAR